MSGPSANVAVAATRSGVGIWFDQHLYSFVASLGRVLRRPWTTLLTVGVMAVALALPLGLGLALDNLRQFTGSVEQSRQIELFLKPEVGVERARALANPLPSLLVVTPGPGDARLVAALQALPETGLLQHDAAWRQRLQGWLGFGARLAWVLAALFGLGALLVVGNTVRLDIQSRREEIGVLQLLGATDGFIRRPFIYLGAWYGLGAGALALGLLAAAAYALDAPLQALAQSYGSGFALDGLDPLRAAGFLLAATVVGWLGAWLVTGHFLRQTRPTET
ncbi:MAG: ABC transporter permease [Lysobacteraceae bacterium]|nr:MAG: ABC transporter permease [Xanthomonadaceae bacterium]